MTPALVGLVLATAGWVQWPLAPKGCSLEVPARLSSVAPVKFVACPFQAEGCVATGAAFAAQTGWGFAGRLEVNGRFATLTRAALPEGTFETLVLEDGVTVAAFRQQLPQSRCVLGTVSVDAEGGATVPVLRAAAENAPVVLVGPVRELMKKARRVEQFGGEAAVLPLDLARVRAGQLTLLEHGGRFAVRELATGKTSRPTPRGEKYLELLAPQPVEGGALYTVWRGERSSVWSVAQGPVLDDASVSFEGFVTSGRDAAWLRRSGEEVELWAATLDGAKLTNARRVTRLAGGPRPLLALGEGHAVLWRDGLQVRVVRLFDGETRALPQVKTLSWDGGPSGVAVAGGEVWARASLEGGPGNDFRLVARFRIAALPYFAEAP